MKKLIIVILLILPLSQIKAQSVLNLKGKKYFSLSAQYLPEELAVEGGYNKYLSSKSVFSLHGRYLKETINYTRVHTGLGIARYSHKILAPGQKWFVYGYGAANMGMEQNTSEVEDGNKSRFIYGLTAGLSSEVQISKQLSLTLSGDINTRWRSLVNTSYYTIRIGINYYIK